ncbi:MAG: hypothetical protein ABW215_08805 [Kibdelosporangium sp.]
MSSSTAPLFGAQNHPAGQITLFPRRDVGARVSALAGSRRDFVPGRTPVSAVFVADTILSAGSN